MSRLTAAFVGLAISMSACSGLPDAECPPPQQLRFDCREAVAAAVAQLPSGHPNVVRVQVVRGDFRAVLHGGSDAHVVFTYADGSRVAVPLIADDTTGVPLPGEAGPY
jgi:hypothetical protein